MTFRSSVLALLMLSACESGPAPAIVFEVTYGGGFEIGFTQRGVVFHDDGTTSSYLITEPGQLPRGDRVSAADLTAKFSRGRVELPPVDGGALANAQRIARQVGTDLGEPDFRGADFGQVEFIAWIPEADGVTYRRVLLRSEGDFVQTNLTPQARDVYVWLRGACNSVSPEAVCESGF